MQGNLICSQTQNILSLYDICILYTLTGLSGLSCVRVVSHFNLYSLVQRFLLPVVWSAISAKIIQVRYYSLFFASFGYFDLLATLFLLLCRLVFLIQLFHHYSPYFYYHSAYFYHYLAYSYYYLPYFHYYLAYFYYYLAYSFIII